MCSNTLTPGRISSYVLVLPWIGMCSNTLTPAKIRRPRLNLVVRCIVVWGLSIVPWIAASTMRINPPINPPKMTYGCQCGGVIKIVTQAVRSPYGILLSMYNAPLYWDIRACAIDWRTWFTGSGGRGRWGPTFVGRAHNCVSLVPVAMKILHFFKNRFYSGNVVLQFIFCHHNKETQEIKYMCLHINGFWAKHNFDLYSNMSLWI